MFRGVQQVNMDAKGRLAIPARQREPLLGQCDGKIVVTIDTQAKCLVIYPLPEWERIEKEIQELPALNPAVKRFQRLVLGYATDIELDGNGRMLLPPAQREYAQLGKSVILVGQGNKLELWSDTLWQAEQEQALADSGPDAVLPAELLSLKL
ncbi:division/cell wall cluster transcriptional repressor MraZ [Mangrovimicrobium sediminis]|uniref:Transcriptional regulator MraZ n=1 Tax=Mangrovimicrobium sediminis TaxID=2562682 RepID=A0A4Z0M382_9GAMM|nr:division/cell wall cluster transcriptional repressor MraZ [Haliea sp. SAOS-164]TGD74072.1 division/cell wall cluster transcriptional repressor MraZ [Haliea sp. SAOS-164]